LYADGLLIFELFSRKIQDFLKENLEFFKSEKSWIEILQRHLLPNFEPSSILLKFSKQIFKFFDSWVFKGISKLQSSEYEVHQVGSNEGGSQNFSFLALNTAELAVPQISSKNRRQRRWTALIPFGATYYPAIGKIWFWQLWLILSLLRTNNSVFLKFLPPP
jgi:hypothetical protein